MQTTFRSPTTKVAYQLSGARVISISMPAFTMHQPELTEEQKTLVRDSFARAERMPDVVGLIFYRRLFELDPQLRPLFQHDIQEQSKKLMATLKMVVDGLEHSQELVTSIRSLGRRHVQYGVKDQHYDTVGDALLWALEKALVAHFSPSTRHAWRTVYNWMAATMKEAAAEVQASFDTTRFTAPPRTGETSQSR
jgi:hemoglobin-like flavoprotein